MLGVLERRLTVFMTVNHEYRYGSYIRAARVEFVTRPAAVFEPKRDVRSSGRTASVARRWFGFVFLSVGLSVGRYRRWGVGGAVYFVVYRVGGVEGGRGKWCNIKVLSVGIYYW